MARTILESLISISTLLAATHESVGENAELTALHEDMWLGVNEHADALGLSSDDIDAIGAAGQGGEQRSGGPKERPK